MSNSKTLRFEDGATQFRQRIVVSLLSHRPLLIRNIRSDDTDSPGLRNYEVSFLRLLDRITNGSRLEINATGTQVRFVPGILVGGTLEHACPVLSDDDDDDALFDTKVRSIGWFIEGILPLLPFGKDAFCITFTGVTDGTSERDASVDYWQATALPLLARFGVGQESKQDFLAPESPSIRWK